MQESHLNVLVPLAGDSEEKSDPVTQKHGFRQDFWTRHDGETESTAVRHAFNRRSYRLGVTGPFGEGIQASVPGRAPGTESTRVNCLKRWRR